MTKYAINPYGFTQKTSGASNDGTHAATMSRPNRGSEGDAGEVSRCELRPRPLAVSSKSPRFGNLSLGSCVVLGVGWSRYRGEKCAGNRTEQER